MPLSRGATHHPSIVHATHRRFAAMAATPPKVVDPAKYSERWEIMWQGGSEAYEVKGGDGRSKLQPGQSFDAGCSPPHLVPTIESLGLSLATKTAVVPGCGRGYDVETFAKYAASATGLEYSPTAVEEAMCYLKGQDNARVVQCDFFNHASTVDEKFDIGYDYTFFCAIHPSMRGAWAQSWAELLRPGGTLIATVFPVFPDDKNPFLADKEMAGPPWPVVPDDYKVLEKHGFELVSMSKVADGGSHQPRTGMEWVGVWSKKSV